MTAIPSSRVMPCVEKGRGPDVPIAADMQALCPARLRGGDPDADDLDRGAINAIFAVALTEQG